MMDPLLAAIGKVLEAWGLPALGWLAFFWLLIRYFSLQERIMTMALDTAKALTLLAERIERSGK